MCVAIPMQIKEISDNRAKVSYKGVIRETSLILIEDPKIGDWVLMHSGYAITKIDEEEANKTISMFEEIDRTINNEDN